MTAHSPCIDPPRDWCDELIRSLLREMMACQEPCADVWCCIEQEIWWPMYLRRLSPPTARGRATMASVRPGAQGRARL